jgi:hypothetical protein
MLLLAGMTERAADDVNDGHPCRFADADATGVEWAPSRGQQQVPRVAGWAEASPRAGLLPYLGIKFGWE